MTLTGGCHCGRIRYEIDGEPANHSLCHCADCRRAAGAPVVAWAMYPEGAVRVTQGEPIVYASSTNGRREFCAACGTGLFYQNAVNLPGLIDVQTATLDDPNALRPTMHIQVAERIGWAADMHKLPAHDRWPPRDGSVD